MTGQERTTLTLLLIALTLFTGCHPMQPFYFHEDGDLSHYLDQATEPAEPDYHQAKLADVEFSEKPLTISDPEFKEIWDLSLEECISIALQNSKVLRGPLGPPPPGQFGGETATGRSLLLNPEQANTVYMDRLLSRSSDGRVEAALAAFDAQFSMLGSNNGNVLTQTDRPSTFQPNVIINRNLGGLRTELGKRTATGTQWFLRNQTDYSRGDNLLGQTQPVNSLWETLFEIEVRQPLLQGRGTMVNRIPIVIARIEEDISLAEFEGNMRNLVFDIEDEYWELYFTYRALEAAKVGRDSAQKTWEEVYEKVQGGIENAQSEAQAREQYFSFRADLEQSLRDLYNQEGALRYLLGIAATDGRLIRPSDEPTAARVTFDWHHIHPEALARSADLRKQRWLIQQGKLAVVAAKNQLLPQLDVGATYRWYGIGDNLINADRNGINFAEPGNPLHDPSGSTAFDVLTEGNYQEAAFFFSLQMPVGYRRELAAVRHAQITVARRKAILEEMELEMSHRLTFDVRELDFIYQAAQSQFNRWNAAKDEVDSLEALRRGGKITVRDVLEARRRMFLAQRLYYQALANYNKQIAFVHRRKGSLLEYNNIMLAEGPWPDKAYWDAMGHARERDASYYLDYGWTRPKVTSQGPVHQHIGDTPHGYGVPFERGSADPREVIPTPEPTPASPGRDDDAPQESGPITNRPEGPELNAPRRASFDQANRPGGVLSPGVPFEWGSLGLGLSEGAGNGNGLRQATFEETIQQ
jgi:outer membrane protein TolC